MTERSGGLDTLLFGIDAACGAIVDPLIAEGRLPNLEAVLEDGASGPLESQIPPWTASAWPSMYTGVNPGKHGVFGFLSYEGYEWDVVNATDVRELTLWELLSVHDLTSVVVNVPVTHPATEFDGALVPGYTAPEQPDCHPDGVLERFERDCGDYRIYPDPEREPREEYPELVRMRGDAFRYLADRFDPEFGFVQFQATDSVFHEHPDDEALVAAVYEAVDEQLGRLVNRYDPNTIVVASDHGMGRYDDYEFRVNRFLEDRGVVETTVGGSGMPAWIPILNDRLRDGESGDGGDSGFAGRAIGTAARIGITPSRVGRVLRALGLREVVSSRLPNTAQRAGTERVDFEASMAYMRSRIELGVRINLEGREPNGTVPQEDYERVREELIDAFGSVVTPDGEAIFSEVAPRERYFWGPYAEEAVDVVLVPNEFEQFLSADLKDEPFGEPPEPWNHKLEGLVAIAGDGVDPTADLSSAQLFDVAPTVLASLGVPASDRMDGEALPAVPPTDRRSYPAPDANPDGRVDGTSAAVEQRLRDIGYLE